MLRGRETFLTFVFTLFSGCHEQGYAGNIIVYGICVRSFDIRTRCSASHIQIDPSSGLACLNLLAMQPSTPISAYHHIMIIHTRTHNTITLWKYNIHIQPSSSILKLLESRASPLNQFPSSNSYSKGYKQIRNAIARSFPLLFDFRRIVMSNGTSYHKREETSNSVKKEI